ncbi:hypothetical protein [Marinobacter changyiensis]|uniref:hypothetical protein n=1 Tax=Marinobacter changyiensis TaxID=2604091 RepID=UPI001265220A
MPTHHHLAARRSLAITELVNEPVILFGRDLAPHYYDRIISLFHHTDVEPKICHEVSHWLMNFLKEQHHERNWALDPGTFWPHSERST